MSECEEVQENASLYVSGDKAGGHVDSVYELEDTVGNEDSRMVGEEELDEEMAAILMRLRQIFQEEGFRKPVNLRYADSFAVRRETNKINSVLKFVSTNNITDVRKLVCAAGYLVGERLGITKTSKQVQRDPWWKRRLEGDIRRLRKDLSKVDAWHRGVWRTGKEAEKRRLDRVYKIKAKGFKATMEELKQRISAKTNRVKRYFNRQKQFTTNQRQFFRNIKGEDGETLPPDPEDTTRFWSDLWGVLVQHDDSKEFIK